MLLNHYWRSWSVCFWATSFYYVLGRSERTCSKSKAHWYFGTQEKIFLSLFTMTEERETAANHIVKALDSFINGKAKTLSLPSKLLIKVDNCCREYKNRCFLESVECLVARGLFDEVEEAFLPVGHTHEDVDETFSRRSNHLRHHDAITLSYLHERPRETCNSQLSVSEIKGFINWSCLCINDKATQKSSTILPLYLLQVLSQKLHWRGIV